MNVIVITLDTLRYDHLGCNGNGKIRTPAIDAFAKRAANFKRAYCTSFPTVPMRTDCFTGNTNFPRYGWKPLGDEEVLLTEVLRDAGYYTGFVTDTTNMIPSKFPRGFHEVYPIKAPPENTTKPEDIPFGVPEEHYRQYGKQYQRQMANMSHFKHESDWFVARTMSTASDWLEDNHKRDQFFLWVDTFEIHEVWHPPVHYVEQYSPNYTGLDYMFPNYGYTDIYQPEHIERLRARYAGEVTLTDRWVGHLLREIDELQLWDNTMVVLVSDHGMSLGEHNRMGKHTVDYSDPWPLYEEVAHIPLLVWVPTKGLKSKVKALAQPADLMPTILDACKVKGPDMYGRSWLPLLKGKRKKNWDYVFSSIYNWRGEGKIPIVSSRATVTSKRWSLIAAQPDLPAELYDLKADPGQQRNVIKKHAKIAKKMQRALVEFLKESGAEAEYVAMYE